MASPTSARDYYPAAPGGASEFTPENAMKLFDLTFSVGPNVLNQLNRIGSDDIPFWETGLNYGDVARNAGYEGLVADAIGLVGDLVEPGPGEFASVAKWAPALAAAVPRELLEAFGKVTLRGPDGLPERLFHGTPTPVPNSQLRPSTSGMLGPGFYATGSAEEAADYAFDVDRSLGRALERPPQTPAVLSGYSGVPSSRMMDITSTNRFSPEEAAEIAEKLKHYPGLEPVVEMAGRQGVLTPDRLYQGIYDNAPEWAIPEILQDLGYDAIRAPDVGHTVLMNPSSDFIPTWDADKMFDIAERSGQFSPEEIDELLMLLNSFMTGR